MLCAVFSATLVRRGREEANSFGVHGQRSEEMQLILHRLTQLQLSLRNELQAYAAHWNRCVTSSLTEAGAAITHELAQQRLRITMQRNEIAN